MSTIDGMTMEERGGPEPNGICTECGGCNTPGVAECFCRGNREVAQAERIERLEEALREIDAKAGHLASADFRSMPFPYGLLATVASIARAALAGAKGGTNG